MIIIGSGSRDWRDYKPIRTVMQKIIARHGIDFTYYHGNQKGFDQISAYQLRYLNHKYIDIVAFPADWDIHGKAAGMIRNRQMLAEALLNALPHEILLVAMPLETSIGTHGMINICRQAHINIEVYDSHGELIDT